MKSTVWTKDNSDGRNISKQKWRWLNVKKMNKYSKEKKKWNK